MQTFVKIHVLITGYYPRIITRIIIYEIQVKILFGGLNTTINRFGPFIQSLQVQRISCCNGSRVLSKTHHVCTVQSKTPPDTIENKQTKRFNDHSCVHYITFD